MPGIKIGTVSKIHHNNGVFDGPPLYDCEGFDILIKMIEQKQISVPESYDSEFVHWEVDTSKGSRYAGPGDTIWYEPGTERMIITFKTIKNSKSGPMTTFVKPADFKKVKNNNIPGDE